MSAFLISVVGYTAACTTDTLTSPVSAVYSRRATQGVVTLAAWADNGCRTGDTIIAVGPGNPYDANNDYSICESSDGFYDNRVKTGGTGGGWVDGCRAGDTLIYTGSFNPYDKNLDMAICFSGTRYYDNQLEGGNGGGGGGWEGGCRVGDTLLGVATGNEFDLNGDLAVCFTGTDYYDNRLGH